MNDDKNKRPALVPETAAPEPDRWDRRSFLKGMGCGVALLGLSLRCHDGSNDQGDHTSSGRPLAPDALTDERTPILWVEAAVCTGCSMSLLDYDTAQGAIEELLPQLRLEFHETLMERYGGGAMDHLLEVQQRYAGRYYLIVDGAIPSEAGEQLTEVGVDSQGRSYTALALVRRLAEQAAGVVAVGSCASFGGIPGSAPNPSQSVDLQRALGQPVIRLPGCPPHPDWIVGTLSALLAGEPLELDTLGRPTAYFGQTVHDSCPRLPKFMAGELAEAPGDPERCLLQVGCKGFVAYADCSKRPYNGRTFCIGVNHPCLGCTAPGFLDAREGYAEGGATSPFYQEYKG